MSDFESETPDYIPSEDDTPGADDSGGDDDLSSKVEQIQGGPSQGGTESRPDSRPPADIEEATDKSEILAPAGDAPTPAPTAAPAPADAPTPAPTEAAAAAAAEAAEVAAFPKTLAELEEFTLERDDPNNPNEPIKASLGELFDSHQRVREAAQFVQEESGNKSIYDPAGYKAALAENKNSELKIQSDKVGQEARSFIGESLPKFQEAAAYYDSVYQEAIKDPSDGPALADATLRRDHANRELVGAEQRAQNLWNDAGARHTAYTQSAVNNLWEKTFPDSPLYKDPETRAKAATKMAGELAKVYGWDEKMAAGEILGEPSLFRAMRDALLYHSSRTAGKTTREGGKQVKTMRLTRGGGNAQNPNGKFGVSPNGNSVILDSEGDEGKQADQLEEAARKILGRLQ